MEPFPGESSDLFCIVVVLFDLDLNFAIFAFYEFQFERFELV